MSIFVLVFKQGLLAAAGHDLRLRVEGAVLRTSEESVEVDIDASRIVVDAAMRHGSPDQGALSSHDKAEIEKRLRDDVLEIAHYPRILFRSTQILVEDARYRLVGDLELHGHTRSISFDVVRSKTSFGEKLDATIDIHQPDFGIRPYHALLGALAVKPDVTVIYSGDRSMVS